MRRCAGFKSAVGVLLVIAGAVTSCSWAALRAAPGDSAPELEAQPVATYGCPPVRSNGEETGPLPVDQVLEVLLCPYEPGTKFGRQGLLTRGDVRLRPLLEALAVASEPLRTTGYCRAASELLPHVLVKSPLGAFEVVVPRDGCGKAKRLGLTQLEGLFSAATPPNAGTPR